MKLIDTTELLIFAYMAQCRCDPLHTPDYFTWFYSIVEAMQELRQDVPADMQSVVIDERSRGRYTHDDLQRAIKCLGFGNEGALRIDFDEEISDDFITRAWRDIIKRAWRDPNNGTETQRDAHESFRIIAEARGSTELKKLWEEGQNRTMNPDRAYSTLEVPTDVEETMLLTVFSMRVSASCGYKNC